MRFTSDYFSQRFMIKVLRKYLLHFPNKKGKTITSCVLVARAFLRLASITWRSFSWFDVLFPFSGIVRSDYLGFNTHCKIILNHRIVGTKLVFKLTLQSHLELSNLSPQTITIFTAVRD